MIRAFAFLEVSTHVPTYFIRWEKTSSTVRATNGPPSIFFHRIVLLCLRRTGVHLILPHILLPDWKDHIWFLWLCVTGGCRSRPSGLVAVWFEAASS